MKTIYIEIDSGPVRIIVQKKKTKVHVNHVPIMDKLLMEMAIATRISKEEITDMSCRTTEVYMARNKFILTCIANKIPRRDIAGFLNCDLTTIRYAKHRKLKNG